jgi:5-methyltetrahydropteroyltriglutamate--homocysteine methyltransferase
MKSGLVETQLVGMFPRSEKLVEATRALTRGKLSQPEADATFNHDLKALVELENLTSLDSLVDGQLNWQDLFRPFAQLFSGIQSGSLTRWFDNNTFYRKPTITHKISYVGSGLDQYFQYESLPQDSRKKAILPGPFTFAVLSQNSTYKSRADLVDDLAHALRETIVQLERAGYTDFQFNEPALTATERDKLDFETAQHGIEICTTGLAAHTMLHTYFGDGGPVIDELLDYPVDCIGLDFYETSLDSLAQHDFNKELGCGCIDGRNSLLETTSSLGRFIANVKERLAPKSIILSPNCDLDFLPKTVADRKVRLLAETKTKLET